MSETTIPACSGRSRRIHTKKCASADKQAGMRIPIRMAEGLILKSSPAPDHHGAAIRSDRDLRPLNRGIPVDHARNAVSTRTQPYGRAFRTLVDNHGRQNALFTHGAHQHVRFGRAERSRSRVYGIAALPPVESRQRNHIAVISAQFDRGGQKSSTRRREEASKAPQKRAFSRCTR